MNRVTKPGFVIAAPASGSGKSMLASGLMRAFSRRYAVQPFKVGPDYIDLMYHGAACGTPSVNLDPWMLPSEKLRSVYAKRAAQADLSIVEGVMGMFDGISGDPMNGSTAGVAELLGLPILLVVDCGKMAGSAAALIHGFHTFDSRVQIAGIIANRVGSLKHQTMLEQAIAPLGIPILGFIPKKDGLIVPERHLGLVTLDDDREKTAAFLESAAEIIEENLDLAAVLEIARTAKPIQLPLVELKSREKPANVRLAVARDEAFCFYYAENLALLAEAGAEIVYFSPIHDPTLPDRIDGIYFGGGYPELHAPALSINESMLSAVRTFAVADHPIFAECGGLMYLTNVFQDSDRSYQMAGILSGSCRMGRRLIMGYRMATALTPNWLLAPAQTLRSHEFHYSIWDREDDDQPLFSYMNALGEACGTDGVCRGNTIASYSHIDFGQDETLVTNFITAMEKK